MLERPSSSVAMEIFCVLDQGNRTPFSLVVDASTTISRLKKLIHAENINALQNVDARALELYQVDEPIGVSGATKAVRAAFEQLDHNHPPPLDPTDEISDLYQPRPPKKTIHIIVKLPASDVPQQSSLAPIPTLKLFCVLEHGDRIPFAIDVFSSATVSDVKKLIHAENINALQNVDARALELYQVDQPIGIHGATKAVHAAFEQLDHKHPPPLDPTLDLSELYHPAPPRKTIHMIIKPPPVRASKSNQVSFEAEAEKFEQLKPAITKAWTTHYEGNSHRDLYNIINEMKTGVENADKGRDYSNTASILQTSGSGKSRMVHEQSAFVFTIPLNLRPSAESKRLAYPPSDSMNLVNKLITTCENENLQRVRYHTFFLCLFRSVEQEVIKKGQLAYEDLAAEWRNDMRIDVDVVSSARNALYNQLVIDITAEELLLQEEARKGVRPDEDFIQVQLKSAMHRAEAALENLLHTLSFAQGYYDNDRHVKLVVYFDEAHELINKTVVSSEQDKTLYDILLSVLNCYTSYPLFVLFLSTISRIAHFAPPASMFRSARAISSKGHQPPITETPFDCSPKFPLQPDAHTWREVSKIQFMAQFGRPLFWTMLEGCEARDVEAICNNIIGLARHKLLGQDSADLAIAQYRPTAKLAVVDVRFCLQFDPVNNKEVHNTLDKLIAQHMRMAYSVPKDRTRFRSGYSSEPILAEAATLQLNKWRKETPTVLIDILNEELKSGLLDRGERGEIAARALITEAYDQATLECRENDSPLSNGCGVVEFIQKLYKDSSMITRAFPDNVTEGKTFEQAFLNARLRITHWVRSADDHQLNTEAMAPAFIRGMAFICRRGEELVDFVIPMLLEDKPINEPVMSAIFLQIKLRKIAGKYHISADDLNFFPAQKPPENPLKPEPKRPYITIVMDLGVKSNIPAHAKFPKMDVIKRVNAALQKMKEMAAKIQAKATQGKRKNRGKNKSSAPSTPSKIVVQTGFSVATRLATSSTPLTVNPRYAITAIGCSNTVYGVIREEDRQKWQNLLQQEDLLAEHPRPSTVTHVLTQKPFWTLGKPSYSWYNRSFLNISTTADQDDDRGVLYVPVLDEDIVD